MMRSPARVTCRYMGAYGRHFDENRADHKLSHHVSVLCNRSAKSLRATNSWRVNTTRNDFNLRDHCGLTTRDQGLGTGDSVTRHQDWRNSGTTVARDHQSRVPTP